MVPPTTGLLGLSPVALAVARATLFPLLRLSSRFRPALYPGTVERTGQVLAEAALGSITPPAGRVYLSVVRGEVTFPDPSQLARDDSARNLLWHESAAMVGLSA